MISDTIKAVREAEEKADGIKKEALEMHDELIEKAHEDAKAFKEDAILQAENDAASLVQKAQEDSASFLEAAEKACLEDAEKMKKDVFSRKQEFIDAVINKIIS